VLSTKKLPFSHAVGNGAMVTAEANVGEIQTHGGHQKMVS